MCINGMQALIAAAAALCSFRTHGCYSRCFLSSGGKIDNWNSLENHPKMSRINGTINTTIYGRRAIAI